MHAAAQAVSGAETFKHLPSIQSLNSRNPFFFLLESSQDEHWIRYILSWLIFRTEVRLWGLSYCLPALALTVFSALIRRPFILYWSFGYNQSNVAVCLMVIAQSARLPTFRPGELVQRWLDIRYQRREIRCWWWECRRNAGVWAWRESLASESVEARVRWGRRAGSHWKPQWVHEVSNKDVLFLFSASIRGDLFEQIIHIYNHDQGCQGSPARPRGLRSNRQSIVNERPLTGLAMFEIVDLQGQIAPAVKDIRTNYNWQLNKWWSSSRNLSLQLCSPRRSEGREGGWRRIFETRKLGGGLWPNVSWWYLRMTVMRNTGRLLWME